MATIRIDATKTSHSKMVEFNATHLWYDVIERKMHSFYGGQLKYSIDAGSGRMIPHVEPLYISKKFGKSSIWKIKEWFESNSSEYGLKLLDSSGTHLEFSVPDDGVNFVENALQEERFNFQTEKNAKSEDSEKLGR